MIDHLLFTTCWKKNNSVSIHDRNMHVLATEIFKVNNNIAPEIMKEPFAPKISPYDLHNNNLFKRRRVNYVWQWIQSVSYLGPKIWDLVPSEVKESESLNTFKFKMKRWIPEGCACIICKIYLGQVGFITTLKKLLLNEIKLCYHYYNCIQVVCHFRLMYSSFVLLLLIVFFFFWM